MPWFDSFRDNAAPPTLYKRYPGLYGPWSEMSQILMNGESSLSEGERELVASVVAGVIGCRFVEVAHAEVAYEWGVEEHLVADLVADIEAGEVEPRLRALLRFARRLALDPTSIEQADADAVVAAGVDDDTIHDVVAITARIRFMHTLVGAYGFVPISREEAREHARKRVELGYQRLYPQFRDADRGSA